MEDSVLASTEKYATHSTIKMIKSRMNDIKSNFFSKFFDQVQVFKEIKKLDGNKASQKNDIPIKIIKKNVDIISYILYHNFNNLTLSFQVN